MTNAKTNALPDLDEELYECYPAMSAATHEFHVKRYAQAAVNAALAQQASGQDTNALVAAEYNRWIRAHPIPQWLRDAFSAIEDKAWTVTGMQVFTDMRTKVQAYFETQQASGQDRTVLDGIVDLAVEAYDHWDNDRVSKVGKALKAISGLLPGYDNRADDFHAARAAAKGEA